ncbi:MAG: glycoside hydrolase family 25 protein [Lachnospiraceae bacterium]|nr:glycoside hydrolase family 25 protein [Lachnospiraceae bacterium]
MGLCIKRIMRVNIKKVVLAFLLADMLICLGVIIGLNINSRQRGTPIATLVADRSLTLGDGISRADIEENFWSFIDNSYIVVGSAPDYTFYKIVSQVPRNDYEPSRFYSEDEDLIFYHDSEGNRISHLAIDVSTYQGDIDWQQVKASGVDTVMIRAGLRGYGNGKLKEDPSFVSNIEGATAAGLRVGVYFFSQATNEREGIEEANYVLGLIDGYNVSCPIAIDTEFVDDSDARTYNLDITSRTDGVVGFCETVKAAGYEPMIYANRNWFVQSLDMTRLGSYKLWVAHYAEEPNFPYMYNGWQYTEQGSVPGITGSVDLNVWFD